MILPFVRHARCQGNLGPRNLSLLQLRYVSSSDDDKQPRRSRTLVAYTQELHKLMKAMMMLTKKCGSVCLSIYLTSSSPPFSVGPRPLKEDAEVGRREVRMGE